VLSLTAVTLSNAISGYNPYNAAPSGTGSTATVPQDTVASLTNQIIFPVTFDGNSINDTKTTVTNITGTTSTSLSASRIHVAATSGSDLGNYTTTTSAASTITVDTTGLRAGAYSFNVNYTDAYGNSFTVTDSVTVTSFTLPFTGGDGIAGLVGLAGLAGAGGTIFKRRRSTSSLKPVKSKHAKSRKFYKNYKH
jgi:hypothetical protein